MGVEKRITLARTELTRKGSRRVKQILEAKEIETLEKGLHQTEYGHPAYLCVTGELGIGKSSLVSLIRSIAGGELDGLGYDRFNFVVLIL